MNRGAYIRIGVLVTVVGVLLFFFTSFEFIDGVDQTLTIELNKPKPAQWLKLSDVPKPVLDAILAAEGPGFLSCNVNEALAQAVSEYRGGASENADCTLPKLLFNNPGWPGFKNGLLRGLESSVASVMIFKKMTNEEILEMVLNRTYFGRVGGKSVWGIDQAAQAYFSKPVNGLELRDAATLAGIIKSPNDYSPLQNIQRAKERRDYVLTKMADLRFINSGQASAQANQPIELNVRKSRTASEIPLIRN